MSSSLNGAKSESAISIFDFEHFPEIWSLKTDNTVVDNGSI